VDEKLRRRWKSLSLLSRFERRGRSTYLRIRAQLGTWRGRGGARFYKPDNLAEAGHTWPQPTRDDEIHGFGCGGSERRLKVQLTVGPGCRREKEGEGAAPSRSQASVTVVKGAHTAGSGPALAHVGEGGLGIGWRGR
jgi:hypothetical protein